MLFPLQHQQRAVSEIINISWEYVIGVLITSYC
jgi:hypothetical protein